MPRDKQFIAGLEDALIVRVRTELGTAFNTRNDEIELTALRTQGTVTDSPVVLLARLQGYRWVVHISPRSAPDVIEEEQRKASEAKAALGETAGSVVLLATHQGRLDGLSYSVTAFHQPISQSGIELPWKPSLRAAILEWLRTSVSVTLSENICRGDIADSVASLRDIADSSSFLRLAAEVAYDRCKSDEFSPRKVLMHGDLWSGNLLKCRNQTYPFYIIDWRGSRKTGYPIFDLVRMAQSLKIPHGRVCLELFNHARLLKCELQDARTYLVAALGSLAANLDQFPTDRFIALAESALVFHDSALQADGHGALL